MRVIEIFLDKEFNNTMIKANVLGEAEYQNFRYSLGEVKEVAKRIKSVKVVISKAKNTKKNTQTLFVELLEREPDFLAVKNHLLDSKIGRSIPHKFFCSVDYIDTLCYVTKKGSFTSLNKDDLKEVIQELDYKDFCDAVLCLYLNKLLNKS